MTAPHTDSDAKSERRRQILAAAVHVFAAKGHEATRIQDIADQAGVAYGLVYHYFGTKEALLQVVFDENWAIFADVVEGIASSPRAPEDRLRAVLDYVFGAVDAFPDRIKVILVEYGRHARRGEALRHPDVARVLGSLARSLTDLRPGVDARALSVLLLGALEAAIVAMLSHGPDADHLDARRVRDTVIAIFRGVSSPPVSL